MAWRQLDSAALSAAEAFSLLVRLVASAADGQPLESLPWQYLDGPASRLDEADTGFGVDWEELVAAASRAARFAARHGRVPSRVLVGNHSVFPADFLATTAEAAATLLATGRQPETVTVLPFDRPFRCTAQALLPEHALGVVRGPAGRVGRQPALPIPPVPSLVLVGPRNQLPPGAHKLQGILHDKCVVIEFVFAQQPNQIVDTGLVVVPPQSPNRRLDRDGVLELLVVNHADDLLGDLRIGEAEGVGLEQDLPFGMQHGHHSCQPVRLPRFCARFELLHKRRGLVHRDSGVFQGRQHLLPPRGVGRIRRRQLLLQAMMEVEQEPEVTAIFGVGVDDRLLTGLELFGFERIDKDELPNEWREGYDPERPSIAYVKRLGR